MTTRIILPGQPITFARTATTVDGATGQLRQTNPARYRQWKHKASDIVALTRRGVTYDEPVTVDLEVYADGIIATFAGTIPPARPKGLRGDLDNYVKAVLDAAQTGHLLDDDKIVHAIKARFVNDNLPQ